MGRVNPDNYVVIQGWMLTELNLKGSELMIYAIIFGFTQNCDDQNFSGTLGYLADWANISVQATINTLKRLLEKGLIEKTEEIKNGVKFCKYRSINFRGIKETLIGTKESLPGGIKETLGGGKETLPNNKEYIKDINTKEKNKKSSLERIVSDSDLDTEVKYTIYDFIDMRKLIKAPMTDRAITLLINKLKEMASDPATQIAILNQSIENSWKGIFPLRDNRTKPGNNLKSNWNINRDSTQQYQSKPDIEQGEDFYQYITRKAVEGVN